jgi:hypothetical protein
MAAVTGLLLTAGLAACGSSGSAASGGASPAGSDSSSSSTGKAVAGLVTFHGTFQLRGAVAEQSPFLSYPGSTSSTSSCADIAAKGTGSPPGEQPQFRIPSPPAGSHVFFVASVTPYHGPGSYSRAAFLSGGGASIGVGTADYNPLAPTATVSVTVSANGSGHFMFAKAAPVPPYKTTLSGSVTWTCTS